MALRRTPTARQQRPGHELVARAEDTDQYGNEDRADDVQGERGEVLPRPHGECERERRDEKHTVHDTPRPLAQLTRRVEARACEDEHEQQDQERQPVGLVVPEETPEDRLRVEDVRTESKRAVEADRQPPRCR